MKKYPRDLQGYQLIKTSKLIHFYVEIDKVLEDDNDQTALKRLIDLQSDILNEYKTN